MKEALKLALEWAEAHGDAVFVGGGLSALDKMNTWASAIAKVLAQPEQEPVAYVWTNSKGWLTYAEEPHDSLVSKPLYTTPPQRKPLSDEEELANGLAMALHDAVLIRIGKDDEATQQATARIDKLVNKYKSEAAHGIKE